MAVLAVAFYLDYNKDWKPFELAYYAHFNTPNTTEEVKQLTPKGTNDQERCITCHVPDMAVIGGKGAAPRIPLIMTPDKRNPQAHPDRITQRMGKVYRLPLQYADQPIDLTRCIVCHNGHGLATHNTAAPRNL